MPGHSAFSFSDKPASRSAAGIPAVDDRRVPRVAGPGSGAAYGGSRSHRQLSSGRRCDIQLDQGTLQADRVRRDESSRLFADWCISSKAAGEDPGSQKRFSQALEDKGYAKDPKARHATFLGPCQDRQIGAAQRDATMNTLPSPVTLVPNSSYETTRFNALRHGVLSRHTVLPWEDRSEYQTLLDALGGRARPGRADRRTPRRGAGWDHLAEAPAADGRGGRVSGEAPSRRDRLSDPEHLAGAALLPLTGSADHKANIPQALAATPTDTARDLRDVKRDQTMTRNAWNILAAGGARRLRPRRGRIARGYPGALAGMPR